MSESPEKSKEEESDLLPPEKRKVLFEKFNEMNFLAPQMFMGMSAAVLKELCASGDETESYSALRKYFITPLDEDVAKAQAEAGTNAHKLRHIQKDPGKDLVIDQAGAEVVWDDNKRVLFAVLGATFLKVEDLESLDIEPTAEGKGLRAYFRRALFTDLNSNIPAVMNKFVIFTLKFMARLLKRLREAPHALPALRLFADVVEQAIYEHKEELITYQKKLTEVYKKYPTEEARKERDTELEEVKEDMENLLSRRAFEILQTREKTEEIESEVESLLDLIKIH